MQSASRTNVLRDAIEHVPHCEFAGPGGVQRQMLFAMDQHFRVGKIGEENSPSRRIGGHGFVAEVEAQPIRTGPADHASQQNCGREKIEIGKMKKIRFVLIP